MNYCELFQHHVSTQPHAPALIEWRRGRERVTSFARLDQMARRVTTALRHAGLKPGESVMVRQSLSLELYTALLGVLRGGFVAMLVDPTLGDAYLESCFRQIAPRALVGDFGTYLLRLRSAALERIPRRFTTGFFPGAISWGRMLAHHPDEQLPRTDDDAPALVTFSDIGTGHSKADPRTHGILAVQRQVYAETLGLRPREVTLTTLPMVGLAQLASGVTTIVPPVDLFTPRAADARATLALLRRYGPARASMAMATWHAVHDLCQAHGHTLPALRHLSISGPIVPHYARHLAQVAPRCALTGLYGASEADPITAVAAARITDPDYAAMAEGKGMLVGTPVDGLTVRIVRQQWGHAVGPFTAAEFRAECTLPGVPGEIVISGAHVIAVHASGAPVGGTTFTVDGTVWHRTGDAGYLDAAGRLWLLGRCEARIDDDRGIIYPFTVECAAAGHPGVRRMALVSYAGRRVLVLQPQRGYRHGDWSALSAKISWAMHDEIRELDHIPIDPSHPTRIDYATLRHLMRNRQSF